MQSASISVEGHGKVSTAGSTDARGRRGPGLRHLSAPENFQKASMAGITSTGGQLILPSSGLLSQLPVPGCGPRNSESQMHAWAAATDLVGRACWPREELRSPCRTLSSARPANQAAAALPRIRTGRSQGPWGSAGPLGGQVGDPRPRGGAGRGLWAEASCQDEAGLPPQAGPCGLSLLLPDAGAGLQRSPQTFR